MDDPASEVRVRPIPKRIDTDGLHINSHFVHVRQALIDTVYVKSQVGRIGLLYVASPALTPDAILDQFPNIGNLDVTVNVNAQHPMTANDNLPALAIGAGLRGRLLPVRHESGRGVNTAAA